MGERRGRSKREKRYFSKYAAGGDKVTDKKVPKLQNCTWCLKS